MSLAAKDARETALRGLALHREGRRDEAESHYRAALRLSPDEADALNLLGVLLCETRRTEEALSCLRQAAAIRPEDPSIQLNLGHAEQLAGNPAAAEERFGAALALDPANEGALLSLGSVLQANGQLEAAERLYRDFLLVRPRSPQVLFNLASALNARGGLDEAETLLEGAVAAAPRFLPALGNLAAIRLRRGKLQEAIATYRRALALAAHPQLAIGLGNALYRAGDYDGAAGAFADAARQDPRQLDAHAGLVNALSRSGRAREALRAAEEALRLAPGQPRLLNELARLLSALGRPEEALSALKSAVALEPHDVRAHAALAPLLRAAGREPEARALFDFSRLLFRRQHQAAPGYASLQEFNRELAAYIRARPDHTADAPDAATRGGSQTGELLTENVPPLITLKRMLAETAEDALSRYAGYGALAYFREPPARWRLISNGVILRSSGHQNAHVHLAGYLSGVYYVEIPPEVAEGSGPEGCIRFTETAEADSSGPRELLRPRPGLMVLFPSYFWHGTEPFTSDSERICVAFDLVPEGAALSRSATAG